MGDLVRAHKLVSIIEITDDRVYVEESGEVREFETLRQMLETTVLLAKRFRAGRAQLPVAPWERQMLSAWQTVAREYAFSFDAEAFEMRGNYKNLTVRLFPAIPAAAVATFARR